MKNLKLTVEKRKIFGKKLKKLRRDGILPANIYGKKVKSVSVQVPYKEFEKIFKEAGETGVVDVEVDGAIHPSLIHNIHHDYLNNRALHVDFFEVNLKEKVKTSVPLLAKGEAKAISDKLGLLLQPLTQVEVEALPMDLPEHIEINVEALAAVGDQITIGQIKAPTGVTILTDPNQVAIKVGELISKEAAEQAAAEAAAKEAAKAASATTTGEAGAAPTEGTPAATEAKPGEPTAGAKPEAAPLRQGSAGQAKTEAPKK